MSSVDQIREQALELPQEARAGLARDLLLSLEPDEQQDDVDSAWAEEIEARAAAVALGEHAVSDWREAMARVRQALSERRGS